MAIRQFLFDVTMFTWSRQSVGPLPNVSIVLLTVESALVDRSLLVNGLLAMIGGSRAGKGRAPFEPPVLGRCRPLTVLLLRFCRLSGNVLGNLTMARRLVVLVTTIVP